MATRTFLAFPIDEATRRQLAEAQRQLETVGAKVRWTDAAQLHVTMKFLGDVMDEDLSHVCDVALRIAAETPAFDFTVARVVSAPPHGHMRMIWVGIDEPTGIMARMHRELDEAYVPLGFKAERRGFHAHLTLGRIKSGVRVPQLRQAIAPMGQTTFGIQGADELVVFSSELAPGGPVYTPLAHAPLKLGA